MAWTLAARHSKGAAVWRQAAMNRSIARPQLAHGSEAGSCWRGWERNGSARWDAAPPAIMLGLMGVEVVQDHINLHLGRVARDHLVHEVQEFPRWAAPGTAPRPPRRLPAELWVGAHTPTAASVRADVMGRQHSPDRPWVHPQRPRRRRSIPAHPVAGWRRPRSRPRSTSIRSSDIATCRC